jgi:hypothetical protein
MKRKASVVFGSQSPENTSRPLLFTPGPWKTGTPKIYMKEEVPRWL